MAGFLLDPPLYVLLAVAFLYARGGRLRAGRAGWFLAGLVVLLLALDSPLDNLAQRSFAAHMAQHVLLLSVAPPLLLLGSPWPRVWPRRVRGTGSRLLLRALGPAGHPAVALALAAATLGVWHIPALYDAALGNAWLHALEHLLFVGTSLLFWAHVIDVPPLRARLDDVRRAAYLALALASGWILAIVLAFAQEPLYGTYVHAHRPWGLSAISDQQLAAGVMWVPGSFAYAIALVAVFYRWLGPEAARRRPRPEELSWTT